MLCANRLGSSGRGLETAGGRFGGLDLSLRKYGSHYGVWKCDLLVYFVMHK